VYDKDCLIKIEKDRNTMIHALKKVAKGNFEHTLSLRHQDDELYKTINDMIEQLQQASVNEKQRIWVTEGLAKFNEIIRQTDSLNIKYDCLLKELVKYVGAHIGAIYIAETIDDEVVLSLKACYAYNRKKYINKKVYPGEGLLGAVWLEKEEFYMTDVPNNYINIESGSGESKPSCIYIVPIKNNDSIHGVIELASFELLAEHKKEYVRKIAETLSYFIAYEKLNEIRKIS